MAPLAKYFGKKLVIFVAKRQWRIPVGKCAHGEGKSLHSAVARPRAFQSSYKARVKFPRYINITLAFEHFAV
jgi:hypothetical protein